MLTKKTTLVLGAGASFPYGLPLGAELRRRICSLVNLKTVSTRELFQNCGVELGELVTFARTFARSKISSVDTFLGLQPRFSEVGKVVIAREICSYENPDAVTNYDNAGDWYAYLWNRLAAGTATGEELIANPIRIISFNYDRSFEFFYFDALKHTYGLSDDSAMTLAQKLEIIHPYGTVGKLHHEPGKGRKLYVATVTSIDLRTAADSIRVIPESRKDDEVFAIAKRWLHEAEHIGFIGFGFDELNCERLGLNEVLMVRKTGDAKLPKIFATVYGMTNAEVDTAKNLVGIGAKQSMWTSLAFPCLDALRNSTLLQ